MSEYKEEHTLDDDSIASEDVDNDMEEYGDDDVDIDEYANQNRDVNDVHKIEKEPDGDEAGFTQFDFDDEDDYNDDEEIRNTVPKLKNDKYGSNIIKMTKYEFCHLVGKIAKYIIESKISIPEEMSELPVVKTGNPIKIALFWVENRKTYTLPLSLKRQITTSFSEELRPELLTIEDDYHFKDENDDTAARFYQNFREKPYENDV